MSSFQKLSNNHHCKSNQDGIHSHGQPMACESLSALLRHHLITAGRRWPTWDVTLDRQSLYKWYSGMGWGKKSFLWWGHHCCIAMRVVSIIQGSTWRRLDGGGCGNWRCASPPSFWVSIEELEDSWLLPSYNDSSFGDLPIFYTSSSSLYLKLLPLSPCLVDVKYSPSTGLVKRN